jgi:antitoxin component of MazEF toxin-antitoxin module
MSLSSMSTNSKIITKPWNGNSHGSLVVSIPKRIAKNCNLTSESYITINDENGLITIKKLELGELK